MAKELIVQLDEYRELGIQAYQKSGFERASLIANATSGLEKALTPAFMKPFMDLQGKNYGFKSDKIYDEATVKHCLIEAVMMGVEPVGNHFNIIAKNSYITKEGFGFLLKQIQGLSYRITPGVPRISGQSALIEMKVSWTMGGVKQEEKLNLPIKVNSFMGPDAVIGKATRKARKWLFETITGSEVPDGDITEAEVLDITATSTQGVAQVDEDEDEAPETPEKAEKPSEDVKIPETKVTPPHETTGGFEEPEKKKPKFAEKMEEKAQKSKEGELFPKDTNAAGRL